MELTQGRKASYQIDPIFTERWSPRSFLNKEVPNDILNSIFEAARWAPSAANVQPWRFVIARSEEDRQRFISFIAPTNVVWCKKAPVLVAIISKTDEERFGGMNPTHSFDTGAAWGYLALEATRKGLITHGMGGFDREKAKEVLGIPENYFVNAIVAVGYQGEKELLEESFHDREKPSDRKPIEEFVFEGLFEKNR